MATLRDQLNARPWLGWAFAGVVTVAAVTMYFRMRSGSEGVLSGDTLTEEVTVKFTDTGETVKMLRGRLTRELLGKAGKLDPAEGIVNPKTGKASGVLVSDGEWQRLVAEINALKDDAARNKAASNR
ncbi:MAG TPA: hypothetical protein VEB22_12475 [Phycisphaerales bacterium]|nr:hypothetical protein [Phycisphaerales bacterium]